MQTIEAGNEPLYISCPVAKNNEFMHWQYVPIKLPGADRCYHPCANTKWTQPIIDDAIEDFCLGNIEDYYWRDKYYVYLTIKSRYVDPKANECGNRPGWHCDGFLTDDVNYIWTDRNPTEWLDFKHDGVLLAKDHKRSMEQMQALGECMPDRIQSLATNSLYKLDSTVIHRVAPEGEAGFRNFVKVSISKERYLLRGNSINHILDYDWSQDLVDRKVERNCPQG